MNSHFYFLFKNNVHITTFESKTLEGAIKEANVSFPRARLNNKGVGSDGFELRGESNITLNIINSLIVGVLIGAVFALCF
jgi:hypothetical protein